MTDDSDLFLLWAANCEAIGSRLSILGDPRCSTALEGEPALKGFEMAESGVGSGPVTLGDRLVSKALRGVMPLEVMVAGVDSCDLLDLGLSLSGLGEPLRSDGGDLGGTSGGYSTPS